MSEPLAYNEIIVFVAVESSIFITYTTDQHANTSSSVTIYKRVALMLTVSITTNPNAPDSKQQRPKNQYTAAVTLLIIQN